MDVRPRQGRAEIHHALPVGFTHGYSRFPLAGNRPKREAWGSFDMRAKMIEDFHGDEAAMEVGLERIGPQLKHEVKVPEVAPAAVLQ